MGYPRRLLVDALTSGFYHCVSRCVRRAHLCGEGWEHRRQWIEDRLVELLGIFAIASCAYSILSNHLHLVVRIDPQVAEGWSNIEVVKRWLQLFPRILQRATKTASSPEEARQMEEDFIARTARDHRTVTAWRSRLADLGWFNKLLKEPIARRANQEDGCTGHFWEGRFRSYRLLDDAAILACMVYVDLNQLRAGMVARLQECTFTSILQRMKSLKAAFTRSGKPPRPRNPPRGRASRMASLLIPIESLFLMTARQYVSLVAQTGGVAMDEEPHVERLTALGIDAQRWTAVLKDTVKLFGTAVGSAVNLLKEAARRGARRVINPIDVYRA
jgi:REP element-mobilizing transposase RayT